MVEKSRGKQWESKTNQVRALKSREYPLINFKRVRGMISTFSKHRLDGPLGDHLVIHEGLAVKPEQLAPMLGFGQL